MVGLERYAQSLLPERNGGACQPVKSLGIDNRDGLEVVFWGRDIALGEGTGCHDSDGGIGTSLQEHSLRMAFGQMLYSMVEEDRLTHMLRNERPVLQLIALLSCAFHRDDWPVESKPFANLP